MSARAPIARDRRPDPPARSRAGGPVGARHPVGDQRLADRAGASSASSPPPATDGVSASSSSGSASAQVLILIAFMFSFVLAMTAAFLGAPGDRRGRRDRHRPGDARPAAAPLGARRSGAGSGCRSSSAAYAVAVGPARDRRRRLGQRATCRRDPLLAVAYLAGQAVVVLTLARARSGPACRRSPRGAIAVVAVRPGWFAGRPGQRRRRARRPPLAEVSEASRFLLPTDGAVAGRDLRPRAAARRC